MLIQLALLWTFLSATAAGEKSCTCDAYDACEAELADKRAACRRKAECVDLLADAPDADAIVACFEEKAAAEETRRDCILRQAGKPCEGAVDEGVASGGGQRGRHGFRRHKRASAGGMLFPKPTSSYTECVRGCIERPSATDKKPKHMRGRLSGGNAGCARSLRCPRSAGKEQLKAAQKACRGEMKANTRKQLCTCLQAAGVDACAKPDLSDFKLPTLAEWQAGDWGDSYSSEEDWEDSWSSEEEK